MTNTDVIRDAISNGLTTALAEADEMVNRWVSVIETIDNDGIRSLWIMTADGTKPWDSLGMLQFAAMQEQAQVMRYDVDEDDE